ncbi:ROK family transcriptional regulator [Actinoplanes sp. NPDC051494]|uniref:ROK family transcriptional regulator n=1 Tax=Actinoplanes sp. NPDC051494 TaxID=3363907 RepID=UPI00378DF17A
MDPAKPSLDLVRTLTDEHVVRALIRHRRLTRAEIATATGLSKPTAGESVRRLAERGILADTGERTPGGRGRGRVGSYYALTPDAGTALAIHIGPEGIVAERVDAYGDVRTRTTHPLDIPAVPSDVAAALTAALTPSAAPSIAAARPARARLAVVSAADPVDRRTGRLRRMPDAPFLLGDLDPVAVLDPHVDGPVTVDNDVNWAARAERDAAPDRDDFAYVHLGEGLGCAIVSDGEVRRGGSGLAGELAHLTTTGPDGTAMSFIDVFGHLALRRPGSTAIDAGRLLAAAADPAVRAGLARAVGGVLNALVALADPATVIVGGSWGGHPALLAAIAAEAGQLPRPVPVRAATLTAEPSLIGARADAVTRLRGAIVEAATRAG